jgi:hypothetical protein
MIIIRNADDGHMNVGQKLSRSSLVIVSDMVVPLGRKASPAN